MAVTPVVTFTRKLVEPDNTFRASTVFEMFDVSVDPTLLNFVYSVGLPFSTTLALKIRNITVSNDLQVILSLPDWMTVDVPSQFLLNRGGETRTITVMFNQANADLKSQTWQRTYLDQIDLDVIPLQVSGPVYVLNNPGPIT